MRELVTLNLCESSSWTSDTVAHLLSLTLDNKYSRHILLRTPSPCCAQWSVLAHLYRLNSMFEQMQVLEGCCLLKICINSFLELPLWYHRSSQYLFRTKNTHLFCKEHLDRNRTSSNYPASLALSTITCKTDVVNPDNLPSLKKVIKYKTTVLYL